MNTTISSAQQNNAAASPPFWIGHRRVRAEQAEDGLQSVTGEQNSDHDAVQPDQMLTGGFQTMHVPSGSLQARAGAHGQGCALWQKPISPSRGQLPAKTARSGTPRTGYPRIPRLRLDQPPFRGVALPYALRTVARTVLPCQP